MFKLSRLALAAMTAMAALAVFFTACGGDDSTGAAKAGVGATGSALQQVPPPDKPAPAGSRVFVGHDKASKTGVGLILFSDAKAAAYVCDGDATWSWYEGTVSGAEAKLTNADGGKFTAKISGTSATGSASSGDFTLDAAKDHAGLYRTTSTKGADTETGGWVIENDGTVTGGVGATVAGKKLTAGAKIVPTQLGDVQALPEFAELKLLAPQFPVLPADRTAFTHAGGFCGRLGATLSQNQTSTPNGSVVNNTAANRARLGLAGLLGCGFAGGGLFVLAT